jgi:hypothetical protein
MERTKMRLPAASPSVERHDAPGEYVESVLDLATQSDGPAAHRIEVAVLGTIAGLARTGEPLVDFPANRSGRLLPARSTVLLSEEHIGTDVVLLFENGDRQKPLVMGIIQNPVGETTAAKRTPVGLQVDDDRVVVTGEREVVLRCGEASITLTRAGKVLIRGTYVLSRSSGVNRIKGGSVQIN